MFNDTIKGPRLLQWLNQVTSLKADKSEGCSPVSSGGTILLCSFWPSDNPPTPLQPLVDTGAEDRV